MGLCRKINQIERAISHTKSVATFSTRLGLLDGNNIVNVLSDMGLSIHLNQDKKEDYLYFVDGAVECALRCALGMNININQFGLKSTALPGEIGKIFGVPIIKIKSKFVCNNILLVKQGGSINYKEDFLELMPVITKSYDFDCDHCSQKILCELTNYVGPRILHCIKDKQFFKGL